MQHPIIDRYVRSLNEAKEICERFEDAFGHAPTEAELRIAATLYIQINKTERTSKISKERNNSSSGKQSAADVPDCPDCGEDMWDNREDKRSARSPDFKCKDKDCGHAIWLDSKDPKDSKKKTNTQPATEYADPSVGDPAGEELPF